MDKNSNSYVALFAVGICVVLSAALAFTFNVLKDTIDANKAFDIQKNVLKAAKLWNPVTESAKSREELEQIYQERIEERVLVTEPGAAESFKGEPLALATGEVLEGKLVSDIKAMEKLEAKKPKAERRGFLPLYRVKSADDPEQTEAYVLATEAYGLWSWLYGFLAVTPDFKNVVGITYYQHGETPGLGGEVENLSWQKQWEGKELYNGDELIGVTVKKGIVSPDDPEELAHYVDGLSGATITSNGVSDYTKDVLRAYEPYLKRNGRDG